MPWVDVYRKPQDVNDELFREILLAIPSAIAEGMDVPEESNGRVNPWDIEIKTFDFNKFDKCGFELVIIVRCEDFPKRRENLKDRIDKAIDLIRPTCRSLKKFIWVRPVEGFFKEF